MGLVAKVTSVLLCHHCNVFSNHEFVDPSSSTFFLRAVFSGVQNTKEIHRELRAVLPQGANIHMGDFQKKKCWLLATKEAHVLGDLLVKCAYGDMNAEIVGVISNHAHLEKLVRGFELPFIHIGTEGLSREEHEKKVIETIRSKDFDLIVLAKYMRILNPSFVEHFPQRIINIHHSFLPAFIGAKPYQQAYERGVKVIGATAHFVNQELDEGPIIAQGVEAVDHQLSAKELAIVGREIEKSTLAKALNKVLEERVFISGNKTIVF